MTKKGIVRTVSQRTGLSMMQTQRVVQQTMDAILDTLIAEQRLELRGFGVFEVKLQAPRRARNPRTGEPVHVPAKRRVTFRPACEMTARIQAIEPAPVATIEAAVAQPSREAA